MICKMLIIAGAMQSPQAVYYAETCYIKGQTYPIRVEACKESLPERAAEFEEAMLAWRTEYDPLVEKARVFLQSNKYDFSKGSVPYFAQVAKSWARAEQEKGSANMTEVCNDHLAELRS